MILLVKRFSKEKNNEDKKKAKRRRKIAGTLAATGIGAGLVASYDKLGKHLSDKAQDMLNSEDTEEGNQLFEKLSKRVEAQGTGLNSDAEWNSVYGSKWQHKIANKFEDLSNNQKISKDTRDQLRDIVDSVKETLGKPGKAGDSINTVERADVLAHEFGHSLHYQGRDGSKLGKASHKLLPASALLYRTQISPYISGGAGFISGIKAEKAKEKGKKESFLNKIVPVAAPIAMAAPSLVSEALASKRGLKELKDAGASAEYLKSAKKNLATAYSTYTVPLLRNVGAGLLGRVAGRGTRKAYTGIKEALDKNKKKDEKSE